MNRKLVLLNLVLAAVAVYAGVQWRNQWKAAKAREAAMLHKSVKPTPGAPFAAMPVSPPGAGRGLQGGRDEEPVPSVASNPNVPVELPPPAAPPPPMPPLPRYHGR